MADKTFLFVGYLVQEPYTIDPRIPGARIATIDRPVHSELDQIRYELINGIPNVTRFLTYLPNMDQFPGYVLNGYAIDSTRVLPEKGIDGVSIYPSKYEYAKHWTRPQDGLRVLGYDVVDEPSHPFSILHSQNYSLDEIQTNCGMLNQFGLFNEARDAKSFCEYIESVDQEDGTIWEVWG